MNYASRHWYITSSSNESWINQGICLFLLTILVVLIPFFQTTYSFFFRNAGQLHFYRNETKHPTNHAWCLALICELIDQLSKYIYLAWKRISEDGCPNLYLFHCVSEKLPHLPNGENWKSRQKSMCLFNSPSIHKLMMFWIFQYELHTDWNELTNILTCLYKKSDSEKS